MKRAIILTRRLAPSPGLHEDNSLLKAVLIVNLDPQGASTKSITGAARPWAKCHVQPRSACAICCVDAWATSFNTPRDVKLSYISVLLFPKTQLRRQRPKQATPNLRNTAESASTNALFTTVSFEAQCSTADDHMHCCAVNTILWHRN